MCDPVSIIVGAIGAVTSVATTAVSNHQQKKAEAKRAAAEKDMLVQSKQLKQTISKTAQTPSINENKQKRTISSLRIPTEKSTVATVNTSDMGTGLNIPI